MKTIKLLFFTLLLSLISCTHSGDDPTYENEATLVYLSADNDLASYILDNFNEMERNFPSKPTNRVFVYIDLYLNQGKSEAVLFEMVRDNRGAADDDTIISIPIVEYGTVNSSSIEMIDRVVGDIKADYPGVHLNTLLMSSHAKAWVPEGNTIYKAQQRSFGDDWSSDHTELDIDELAYVLEKQDFETIIFDACFMSTIEVYYELRNCADFIVASPAEVLAAGMDYASMTNMFAYNSIDHQKLISDYADKYKNSSYTLTYCETQYLEQLAALNKDILNAYSDTQIHHSIMYSLPSYSRYQSSFVDDYYNYLYKLKLSAEYSERLNVLWKQAFPLYLRSDDMLGLDLTSTNGVAFYPPNISMTGDYNSYYLSLDWSVDSGFAVFL